MRLLVKIATEALKAVSSAVNVKGLKINEDKTNAIWVMPLSERSRNSQELPKNLKLYVTILRSS